MSGEKTTNQSSTTATATPQEQALEQMELDRQKANAPQQQQLDNNQYGLANTLLTGGTLPGNLQGAAGVTDAQTQSMVNASLRDIYPQFQSSGILDSGAAIQGGINAAAGVRNQNAQFNVSAIQNLLNQATGSSSNLTGANTQSNSVLGSQLAGLRTTNTSGSTIGMNPFLKSFQQTMGALPGTAVSAVGTAIGCWVASEIFGGWYEPKTIMARFYVNFIAPNWFKEFYLKYGERIANFISNKPIFKSILRPLFELFALKAKEKLDATIST